MSGRKRAPFAWIGRLPKWAGLVLVLLVVGLATVDASQTGAPAGSWTEEYVYVTWSVTSVSLNINPARQRQLDSIHGSSSIGRNIPPVTSWGPLSGWKWGVAAPTWMVLVVLGVPTAGLWYRDWRRGRVRPGLCVKCGYDWAGLGERVVCPECGETNV